MKRSLVFSFIAAIFLISACGPKTQTPTAEPLPSATALVALPTNTSLPLATAAPTETVAATPTNTPAVSTVDYSSAVYLDDRSSPAAVLYSLANAFNRHEFIRAYAYWSSPMDYLGILDAFSNSYANIASVQITMGNIFGEGAAGSIYYTAPAVFTFTDSDNSVHKSSACFLFRYPQPGNFGEPPIDPLHIEKGTFNPVAVGVTETDALASACYGTDYTAAASGNPPEPQALESLDNLGADNFIDNRSGAVEVASSLFNAINRKEYVRAYSYWQDLGFVGNYDTFAAGFNDTGVITATFGDVVSDAGAGQYYYQVPVTQHVQTTTGGTQVFVGCYTLHLSNPGMQAVMPFEPLGLTKGKFALVPDGVDLDPLMANACN